MQDIMKAPLLKDGVVRSSENSTLSSSSISMRWNPIGCDLPSIFDMFMIELKLDKDTLIEWQKHSYRRLQESHLRTASQLYHYEGPNFRSLVLFSPRRSPSKLQSHFENTDSENRASVLHARLRSTLFVCVTNSTMSNDKKTQVKTNQLCNNCLGSGHFKAQCKSVHRCRICQRAHHTLLHHKTPVTPEPKPPISPDISVGSTSAATGLHSNLLLLTSSCT